MQGQEELSSSMIFLTVLSLLDYVCRFLMPDDLLPEPLPSKECDNSVFNMANRRGLEFECLLQPYILNT